ncbi:FkbM family methyltransferase [Neorhodopirellula lusitana]|uniref:FkbM family methyltransferase n=1 Tax=Neorhodopirellula lusitana TaxID=445327 RepID=UPI0024B7460D|nr:FkbM family methyltransferase [Neorhodopirellula lusitana]
MIHRLVKQFLSESTNPGIPNNLVNTSNEDVMLAIGVLLSNQQTLSQSSNINDHEFRIFSQFGDDGIIQYLTQNIKIENEVFIEFGVENYTESNTRFLMMNNNWSGFIMDASDDDIASLQSRDWYWKHNLTHQAVFIDRDNINELLRNTGFSNIGLLHIDIDGNDYHVFMAIDLSELNPALIILEYNSVFGNKRPISIPYDKHFDRTKAHYSNLYWGASLPALCYAASQRGYALVGCNKAGNNAYFVRNDLLNDKVRELTVAEAFQESKFRESRNRDYSLSYLAGKDRIKLIQGQQVLNVVSNELETL